MSVAAFRSPARPSQRDVKAVAGAAITQAGHVQDVIQRGIIPALGAAQGALIEERAAREAADDDSERRLWRHRMELDDLNRVVSGNADCLEEAKNAHNVLAREHIAFRSLTFLGRLRWLFTGKVR